MNIFSLSHGIELAYYFFLNRFPFIVFFIQSFISMIHWDKPQKLQWLYSILCKVTKCYSLICCYCWWYNCCCCYHYHIFRIDSVAGHHKSQWAYWFKRVNEHWGNWLQPFLAYLLYFIINRDRMSQLKKE